MIDEYIDGRIECFVNKKTLEIFSPVIVLKDYESAEVLTLDEVCKVLRAGKEKIRAAVRRGELPGTILGRDIIFPKRLLTEYLLGLWKKPPRKKRERKEFDGLEKQARVFVEKLG